MYVSHTAEPDKGFIGTVNKVNEGGAFLNNASWLSN